MKPFEDRKTAFLVQYKNLIDEFKVDFFSSPHHVPDGKGAWMLIVQTELVDTTDVAIPSPFQM